MVLVWLIPSFALGHYFLETFDDGWEKRWVTSKWKDNLMGSFKHTTGKDSVDEKANKGILTLEDSKFFGISANFDEFSNKDKTLVIQYQLKYEKAIDCGGGYIKIGPKIEDQEQFGDPTKYNIMFGPDKCGYEKRTHLIFSESPDLKRNVLKKVPLDYKQETGISHLYRLVLQSDNTVIVSIDNEEIYKGNLKEDWELLKEKEINDPNDKKPEDWVDSEMMDDPEDKEEPADYPKARIPDPEANQPADWNEADDGKWEAPMIDNPAYTGPWSPKQIKNDAYKGKWVQKKIPNPDYVDNNELYKYEKFGAVGIDLWQVTAGSLFDNIIITDDIKEADALVAEWQKLNEFEKQKKAEASAAEAEERELDEEVKTDAEDDEVEDDEEL